MFKAIEEFARSLGLNRPDNTRKLLDGFDHVDLKVLLNVLKKLPGLEDFVQPDSTIPLRRWRDIIQLRDPSPMETISTITSALAPMPLKVKKMLGCLMN